ncbi:MAG: EVE domain-containing protein [Myxococcales bacterium]|nr:EVE domain-containing protein [Myxococcales bacterium]
MRLWLMKSEPDVFSITDLERLGQSIWEGVRNYQARNWMREMRLGDLVLFYHSNATPPGVVGVGKIVREAYPDPFQHDPKSDYYDPKSPVNEPRWSAVDLGFVERFPREVPLEAMKADPGLLGMKVLEKGSRLSVTPVDHAHFVWVLGLGGSALTLPT